MGAVSLLEDAIDRRIDGGRLVAPLRSAMVRRLAGGRPARNRTYVRCPRCRILLNARNFDRHLRKMGHDY